MIRELKMKNKIQELIKISNEMHGLSFKDVVEVTTGHDLVPLNLEQKRDAELVKNLINSCNHFLLLCHKTKRRFFGNRINEVSRAIENELVEEIQKTGLKPEVLPAMGYPDIALVDKYGRFTYLEVKVSSNITEHTSLRSFYYSSGKKINYDARHLLLGLLITEEKDKYWKIVGWTLIDLSKLTVYLKAEFNASNIDIYKPEMTIAKSE